MKVLMFGWEFPPYISGGLGTACFGLTEALNRAGVEVIFVIPYAKGRIEASHVKIRAASDVEDVYRQVLVTHHPYPGIIPREGTGRERITGDYGHNILAEVRAYAQAGRAIAAEEQFDIIHIHDWMTVYAGLAAREVSGRPLVFHVHSLEFDRSGEQVNQTIYEIERLGLKEADHIICVSNYTKNVVVTRYGVDPARITVVHNAVTHTTDFVAPGIEKRPGEKIILFLGRITFQKGPDYFVEAAAKVLKEMPNVTFVMAGTGDMMPRIVERVASLGLGKHFRFTGFLTGADVDRMYAMSDLYVMPSVSEPFGITPLEAMRHDVPVIISRQSGVSEVIRHAIKVDFWDVDELTNVIIGVLRHPALVKEITLHSREELNNITWDQAAQKVLGVYRLLCR